MGKDKKTDDRLLKEAQKRFKQIVEYTFIGADDLYTEADDEDDDSLAEPTEGGGEQGELPLPGGGQDTPGEEVGETPGENDEAPENADGGGVEGFNPEETGDEETVEIDTEESDDEVIDVDDLTDAQEQNNAEINQVDSKIQSMFDAIEKLTQMVANSENNINSVKAEIEKRNPTQLEKLSMRAKDSYPFSVTPDEYWNEKEATSDYRTEDDENGENQGQYVVTQNDVDGDTDWRKIAASLKDPDLNQTLSQILKY